MSHLIQGFSIVKLCSESRVQNFTF